MERFEFTLDVKFALSFVLDIDSRATDIDALTNGYGAQKIAESPCWLVVVWELGLDSQLKHAILSFAMIGLVEIYDRISIGSSMWIPNWMCWHVPSPRCSLSLYSKECLKASCDSFS